MAELSGELLGVVAASAVCGFFLLIMVIIIGCFCCKRIEKNRIEMLVKKRHKSQQDWANSISPLSGSGSTRSETRYKLGSYQPKIVDKTISQEKLVNGSLTEMHIKTVKEDTSEPRPLRRFSSVSDIRTSEVDGKTVSVVRVKNPTRAEYGQYVHDHYSYQNSGYVVPGYMVGNHIVPEYSGRQVVGQGTITVDQHREAHNNGGIIRGHPVTANNGQLVQGQYVNDAEVVRGQHITSSDRVSANVIKQYVAVEDGGEVVVTLTGDATQLVQVPGSMHRAVSSDQSGVSQSNQEQHMYRGLITPTERALDDDLPQAGVVSAVVEGTSVSPVTSNTVMIEERVFSPQTEDLTYEAGPSTFVVNEEETRVVSARGTEVVGLERSVREPVQKVVTYGGTTTFTTSTSAGVSRTEVIEEAAEGSLPSSPHLPSTTVASVVEGQGPMTNVQISSVPGEASTTSTHQSEYYKVIRKQHHEEHAKLPNWMVAQYEENGHSMEFGEEDRAENSTVTSDVEDVGSFGVARALNPGTGSYLSSSNVNTRDNLTSGDYYTVVDYVDPDQPNQAHQQYEREYSHSSTGETGDVSSSTMFTRTTTQTTRQMVNESAERVPPVYTFTPRAANTAEQMEESVTTLVVSGASGTASDVGSRLQRQGPPTTVELKDAMAKLVVTGPGVAVSDVEFRRQRMAVDGSLEELPPMSHGIPM